MRKQLIEVLGCPICRGDLELSELRPADEEIETGELKCSRCHRRYPIRHGVPIVLPYNKNEGCKPWSFDLQWRLRFAGKLEQGTWLWGQNLDEFSHAYKLRISDGWQLDCGCGPGEHTRNLAKQNPLIQTVGLDVSDSVFAAAARDRHLENLHYVQGDILHPPFKDESFNVLISIGFWHATGDTRQALRNSVGLLKKNGFLAAWLYPSLDDLRTPNTMHEYRMWSRYYFFRDWLFLGLGHRVRPAILLAGCRAISLMLTPFGHVAGFRVPHFKNRYRSNTFILLDALSPQYQHRPTKRQVLSWFEEAGVNKVVHRFRSGGAYFAVKG